MESKILLKIEEIAPRLIESIIEMVKISSVRSNAREGAIFGQGIKFALDKALEISRELGFSVTNLDDKIGFAQYGKHEDYVGVIGHLDVVEAGSGWIHPPFGGHVEDNRIYGRGVLDNKGPTMSCLYAMYVLKELGISLKHSIRIIFGCDEESGKFEDLKHYLSVEKPPIMGFTPDCKYPVVYAERGRATVKVSGSRECLESFFHFIYETISLHKKIEDAMGLSFEDEEFGALEVRDHVVRNDGTESSLLLNIIYPFGISCDEILSRVQSVIRKYDGLKASIENIFLPVKFPKDGFMIKCMQEAYEEVTGLDGTPVTTSGGTYAKMMPNIVPFGPSFPGQKGISHNPNEWMDLDDIMKNAKIYALALYKLAKL